MLSENKSPVSMEVKGSHLFQALYLSMGGVGGTQSQAPVLRKDSYPHEWRI